MSSLDDAPAIFAARNDVAIRRSLPAIPVPYTGEDARTFIRGEVPDVGSQERMQF